MIIAQHGHFTIVVTQKTSSNSDDAVAKKEEGVVTE